MHCEGYGWHIVVVLFVYRRGAVFTYCGGLVVVLWVAWVYCWVYGGCNVGVVLVYCGVCGLRVVDILCVLLSA